MRYRSITLTALLCGAASLSAQDAKPQSLPYVAVHGPEFIAASVATFMAPEDRVIGIANARGAKAYPAGILAQHGLVEDDSPDGPIAVTW
jgi:PAB1-binding protein PBP1